MVGLPTLGVERLAMTVILAIDTPSEKAVSNTGYALIEYGDGMPVILDSGVVDGGFVGFCEWIRTAPEHDVTVCERYVVFGPGDSSPKLAEGVVRFLYPDAVMQTSSEYKTVVKDEVLKRLGYYVTGGHHADSRSAVRHGLHYLVKTKYKPLLKAILG